MPNVERVATTSGGDRTLQATLESAPPLRVRLLGGFTVSVGQRTIPDGAWRLQKAKSVVKLLALAPSHRMRREQLMDLLWPELESDAAANNLYYTLHIARRALSRPDDPHVIVGETIRLRQQIISLQPVAGAWIDVDEFEAAANAAMRSADPADYQRALDLYAGDLLPEDRYEDWAIGRREALRDLHVRLLSALARLRMSRGERAEAVETLRRAVAADPTREETYVALMCIYAESGQRQAALRQYGQLVETLRRELDSEPDQETQRLYRQIRDQQPLTRSPSESDAPAPIRPPIHVPPAGVPPPPAPAARLASRLLAHDARPPLAPLVGREREWERLLTAWRAARREPHLALITGEPGIGKTRLAEELLRRMGQRNIGTAFARCYTSGGAQPYAPVTTWLRSDALWPALSSMDDLWLMEAARLVPELLIERPTLPAPGSLTEDWQRQRLFESLRRVFLAVGQPLALLLDDAQWCDRESLDWIHTLLRVTSPQPLLLIATARTEEVNENPALLAMLRDLRHDELVTDVELGPLDTTQTTALAEKLAGHPVPEAAERLFKESEGNPLFIVQFIRGGFLARWQEPATERVPDARPNLPTTLQSLIAGRLAQVSPAARELAGTAAAIGREFSFDVLAEVAGLSEDALVGCLDELWRRRIVRERSAGMYDFSHEKLRDVAYLGQSATRRRMLHKRIAKSLEVTHTGALNPVSAQIAGHYEQAGQTDRAVVYYERAGDFANSLFAWREAEGYFRRALAVIAPKNATPLSPTLLEKLGMTLDIQARVDEARVALERAAEQYRELGDLNGFARATAQAVQEISERDDCGQGLARLSAMRDAGIEARLSASIAAQVQAARVRLYFRNCEYEAAVDASVQAASLAAASGNLELMARAEIQRGSVLAYLDDGMAEGMRVLDATLPLVREVGNLRLLALTLNNLAVDAHMHGNFQLMRRYLDEGIETALAMGDRELIVITLANRGGVEFFQGDWQEARVYYERADASVRGSGEFSSALWPALGFGWLAQAQGDVVAAMSHMERAMRLARLHQRVDAQRYIQSVLAETELLVGKPQRALDRLVPLLDSDSRGRQIHALLTFHLAAWAYADVGDEENAARLIQNAIGRDRTLDARFTLVDALRIQALLALRAGRWEESAAALDEALSMAAAMPYPYAQAKALYVYGLLHSAKGEPQPARERFDQALAILNPLGERLYAQHVERALAALPQ